MNESAIVRLGPEGNRGTNGALMKISCLLINVKIHTHHAHGKGRENNRRRTRTHTHQMGLTHHFLTVPCFYLLSLLSLNAVSHFNNKNKRLIIIIIFFV